MKAEDFAPIEKNGDCFEVTGKAALADPYNTKTTIVHGHVTGKGSLSGYSFGHAWLEKGAFVIDNSNGKQTQVYKEAFYCFGKIDETKVKRYTFQEARRLMLSTKHYGPWEITEKEFIKQTIKY